MTKHCLQCGVEKQLGDFSPIKDGLYGRAARCKRCQADNAKQWYAQNRDLAVARSQRSQAKRTSEQLERARDTRRRRAARKQQTLRKQGKAWRANNSGHVREYARKRYQENPTERMKHRARSKQFADTHRDHIKAYRRQRLPKIRDTRRLYLKEYRKRRPEVIRNNNARRRARQLNAPVIERIDYAWIKQRDRMICHLCRLPVEEKDLHFDHVIPLIKGGHHTNENIAVSHAFCNLSKRDAITTLF